MLFIFYYVSELAHNPKVGRLDRPPASKFSEGYEEFVALFLRLLDRVRSGFSCATMRFSIAYALMLYYTLVGDGQVGWMPRLVNGELHSQP